MINDFKNTYKDHPFLIYGFLVSILLLIIFFVLQILVPEIMKLETKWIIVALCPLLYVLIVGGYVKTFKGFGIELETQLKAAISEFSLLATDYLIELPEDEKRSNQYLDRLTVEERNRIERLAFYSGKKGYYSIYIVRHYLENLPNLKFIEVRNKNDRFECLLPIKVLRKRNAYNMTINNEIDEGDLSVFLKTLENNDILNKYPTDIISESVLEEQSLIEILPKIRKQRSGILGVVDSSEKLIGILDKSLVEATIADEVFKARRRFKAQ